MRDAVLGTAAGAALGSPTVRIRSTGSVSVIEQARSASSLSSAAGVTLLSVVGPGPPHAPVRGGTSHSAFRAREHNGTRGFADPSSRRGARGHRPHQLVPHQPGHGLPHAEPPRQLDRADPALGLGQLVDGRQPGRERQLGVLEHGAGGERELLLAAVALEHLARREPAEAPAAAGRAGQALAPAHLGQGLAAGRLGPEPLPERGLAQASDRTPQPVRRCYAAPRRPRNPQES